MSTGRPSPRPLPPTSRSFPLRPRSVASYTVVAMATQEPPPQDGQDAPSEEELQQRLEEQLRQIRVQDVLLESTVSILNLAARRIAKPDERDLEQGRVGI